MLILCLILIKCIYSHSAPIGYSFQIKNNIWNFSEFVKKHNIIHFVFKDDDYYFTFLDNLTNYDLPYYCSNDIVSYFSSAVCNNITKKCYPIITNNSFFVQEIDNTNKSKYIKKRANTNINFSGLIISWKTQTINIDGQYFHYEIKYRFYCDKSLNSDFLIKKDKNDNNTYQIMLNYNSIYGCPANYVSISNNTRFIFENGDYKIDIDISNYNYVESKNFTNSNKKHLSWSTNVSAYGNIQNYELYFQPSLSIPCPTGHVCGEEASEALIWLCHDKFCEDYGLLENGFNASLATIGGMNGGVTVKYEGSSNRSSAVIFECDRSLFQNSQRSLPIRLPSGIKVNDGFIQFSVGVGASCPKSDKIDPSPLPSVHIPMPKNSSCCPTPDPQPNPSFFVRNSTHYTTFNADEIKQPIFKGNVPLLVDQELGVMYTEFAPWDLIECPKGWTCTAGSFANIWGCWNAHKDQINKNKRSSETTPYCHPIGDKRMHASISAISPNNLDRGVMLKYNGVYSIACEMKIECDRSNSPSIFSLHDSSAIFHRSLNGPDVSYNLSSSIVCPKKFDFIPFPSPLPDPTPSFDPDAKVNYEFIYETVNKTRIEIDMTTFSQSEQWTVFKENSTFELSFVVFNPSKQTKCPTDYECGDFGPANAWKCTKKGQCFPVGDSRYNLSFQVIDQNEPEKGISVVYGGGFAGFSFEIKMKCDKSKKDKLLEFYDVNSQNGDKLIISVSALSSFACPKIIDDNEDKNDNSKISFGSMFILTLLIISIFYISIGSFLTFLKNGIIEMPHSTFWSEFFIDIKAGALFLLTCGNTESRKERREYSGI